MKGYDKGRRSGSEPGTPIKRKREVISDGPKKLDETSETHSMDSASIRDQVELLKDTRLSHSANTEQTARLLKGLQQSHGNAHVQRLLNSRTVQAKLTVHPSDDEYEKEADRVADMVTQPQQQVQRELEEEELLQGKADPGAALDVQRQEEEEEMIQPKPAEDSMQRQAVPEEEEEELLQPKAAEGVLQREEMPEEEEELQMKSKGDQDPGVGQGLEARINAAKGSGDRLPDSVRTSFEARLGHDFDDVRVHNDSEADKLSQELGAKAFTTGRDIFFRSNDYQPHSDEGHRLVGHELTHVVQQSSGTIQTQPEPTGESGNSEKPTGLPGLKRKDNA